LEDYLITAERIPTNKWDTPANVTVITAKEIEENHYQSVEEALSHVNGMIIAYGSDRLNGNTKQMNGGKRVLVLVDGHRWFDPQNISQTMKAYSEIPSMKMIERIEVLKGGNSALYGSDAFSGVVNIVTKKGTKNETTIDLNTGTWRRHQYEITNQGVVGKFSWFLTGRLDKSNEWDFKPSSVYASHMINNHPTAHHAFSARIDNRFTDRDSLTVDFSHMSNHREAANLTNMNRVINNLSLTYNFKEGTSTPGWLRYINNYNTDVNDGTENPSSRLQGVEYQNGWELGQHKIIAGVDWHKSNTSSPWYGYRNVEMITKSAYFQDTISMGDKWTLIPGARYDHSSEFGSNWSPKIATNYRPDEKTKFYATWGRSYNVPLITELYASIPDESDENYNRIISKALEYYYPVNDVQRILLLRIGDRKAKAEKGYSLNIGIEHDFDEKSGVSLNFFQNKLDDSLLWLYLYDTNWSSIHYNATANAWPIKSRGLELTFRQKIDDHFSYNLGYSHTHTHVENQLGKISWYSPQPNGYRIGLNYRNRGLKMNLHGVMASGINVNVYPWFEDTNTIQSYPKRRYAVLDFNLSYDMNENTTFYFKALNLTNQHYSNMESEFDGCGKRIYNSPGRQFIYGMNYKF